MEGINKLYNALSDNIYDETYQDVDNLENSQ